MVARGPRRLVITLLAAWAGLLLTQSLGGCELVLDTGALSETSDAGHDATSSDDSGSGSSSGGMDSAAPADADAAGDAQDATSDRGVSDAADSGDTSTPHDGGSGDAPACTGPTYYVSAASGDDGNPGCSPSTPKRTIAAGISAASTYTASPPTILVCAGTYAETNLQLQFAASLLGGYDCSTWGADAGGPATTTITNASPGTQPATLVMFGSAVKVDGFTIDGALSPTPDGGTSTLTYAAVQINGPGAPTISNDVLTGGSGVGGTPASAGVFVDGPSSPLIENDVISGGSGVGAGTTSVPASVGVFAVNGGAPVLRGNKIDGGSGTGVVPASSCSGSGGVVTFANAGNVTLDGNTVNGGSGLISSPTSTSYGSQALWIMGGNGSTYTITNNVLLGGTGKVVAASTTNAFAVRAVTIGYSASVLFSGNTVDGGVVDSGGQCPQAVDISDPPSAPGPVTVTGNRIHAGHCTAFAAGLIGGTDAFGIRLSGPFTTLTVENNMIDSGQVDVHRLGTAILLTNAVSGAQIRHNTLVAGSSGYYAFGIWMQAQGPTANTIENNIFAAAGPNAVAMNADGADFCGTPDAGASAVRSFQNNLIFGALGGFLRFNCSNTVAPSLDAMSTALAAQGATVAGNLTIGASCLAGDGGPQAGCIPMTCAADGGTCLDTVFAGWDLATSGQANLFSDAGFDGGCPAAAPPVVGGLGDGWFLAQGAATPPCTVARSSLSDVPADAGDAGGAVDLYGNCRGPHPSMGAAEYPASATCF